MLPIKHFEPREIYEGEAPTGLFHFAVEMRFVCPLTGDRVRWCFTTGYCGDSQYECPGHGTPNGASEHYREYMLDYETQYLVPFIGGPKFCSICGVSHRTVTLGMSRSRK